MKIGCTLALLLAGGLLCRAQDETFSIPDIIQGAQEWAHENLDTNVLASFPELDQPKAQQLLRDLQERFQGEHIVDLAALRETADAMLPLLESRADTQPYAVWLRTRMDYLQVADEWRITVPPPKITPGQPPPPVPNPSPAKEREIWVKKTIERPWPPAASNQVSRLKPVFLAQKIPAELVWVAEVESSFDPRARSPVGAAGLFQLMPDTAKRFGLSLWPRDQRFQPEPSARASAQYLKSLHSRFKDWRLALAAYNSGEGTVQKLLDGAKNKTYDAIANRLPAETQLFVPKVEAIVLRREGLALAQLVSPGG